MIDTMFDHWQSITEDDEAIRAALNEANIPSLMNTLVQLTGDVSIIRGDIKPNIELFGDAQGGISAADQAGVREQAFRVLCGLRDGTLALPEKPGEEVILEMITFLTGMELSGDYVEFLEAELSLNGEDPYAQPGLFEIDPDKRADFKVIVIGAGMSGILASIRLKEAGVSFTVVEKNAEVGGTWFENTYPGCRVDSPNHSYSYSFAPRDWPQHYSPQPVLLDYFKSVADEYGIRSNIRFETEVRKAVFNTTTSNWEVLVETPDGSTETLEADALISAVGQLNRPKYPDIEGAGSFDGPCFHSARWEHEHDLTGKKVGVIGTGGSAFQFIPVVAEQAASVTVFQRTPPWVTYREEYTELIPEGKHWLLRHVPYYAKWFRFFNFWRTSEGLLEAVRADPAWNERRSISESNDALRQLITDYVTEFVGDDQELLKLTVPTYPPAGKRMLVDNGTYLTALKRDNVRMVVDPIEAITPNGIDTENESHEFDVLIYGTGFHASRFLWPMEIVGTEGATLADHWQGDPRAYLGVTVPGFPNLFLMYGPNTNIVVNGSIIFFSECEMRYILGCIALLLNTESAAMDCKTDVHDAYNERIDKGNLQMAWGIADVNSWYKNEKGRVTQNWPFTLLEFWQQTREPDPADYLLM